MLNKKLFLFLILVFSIFTPEVYAEKQPKIIGGSVTNSDWPYMAALLYSSKSDNFYAQFCGGTLINSKWVVSAAHCFEDSDGSISRYNDIEIGIGYNDLYDKDFTRDSVRRVIIHPLFNSTTLDYDIALIELDSPSTKTSLPLYSGANSLSSYDATILGWGKIDSGDYTRYLNEADVSIVSNFDCNNAFSFYSSEGNNPVTDNMMCAGDSSNWNVDSCSGDSGGPLIITDQGEKKLAGITSWGVGCAVDHLYGVYTRITEFSDFIDDAMGSATIRGIVTRTDVNGNTVAVEGADVSVNSSGVYDKTDALGMYSVFVPPGQNAVQVSTDLYGSSTKLLSVTADEIVSQNFEMGNSDSAGGSSGCFIDAVSGFEFSF